MKLKTLIRQARAACEWRGHDMLKFKISEHEAYSECRRCGRTCAVLDKPMPNQIDISGSAVALMCLAKFEQESVPNGHSCQTCAASISTYRYRKGKGLCKRCVSHIQ